MTWSEDFRRQNQKIESDKKYMYIKYLYFFSFLHIFFAESLGQINVYNILHYWPNLKIFVDKNNKENSDKKYMYIEYLYVFSFLHTFFAEFLGQINVYILPYWPNLKIFVNKNNEEN